MERHSRRPCSGFGVSTGEVRHAPGDAVVESEPDIAEQGRLVAFDGEQVLGAAPEEILGQRALGVHRIGGDSRPDPPASVPTRPQRNPSTRLEPRTTPEQHPKRELLTTMRRCTLPRSGSCIFYLDVASVRGMRMRTTSRHVSLAVVVGVALIGTILAAPTLAKSAAVQAESAKDHLPDFTIRLVYAPTWNSRQSRDAESLGTFEMEGGIGTLATVGIGDKQSWHAEAEVGMRKTASASSDASASVGAIDTLSLMANGYYGFKIVDKINGYAGAGLGIASHRGDRGSDLALGYQVMVGFGYKLTKEITANIGLRYFGTREASLGRIRAEYRRPEVEVGIGYEF